MDAVNQPLLDIRELSVAFRHEGGDSIAVDRISFSIRRGQCVALVGESGSGKSVSALSVLKLLPYPNASHPSGSILFNGRDLLKLPEHDMQSIRGNDISIIFQEPMTSLNPLHTIEAQIGENLRLHNDISGRMVRERTIELLTQVGIPDPEARLGSYPHQLSGGQRQRVMIAMALANEPDLLIADEPTTALDVTVQAQILALLADIRKRLGMSLLFITHDLGIVRRIADVVCVMNSGKIVEQGPVEQVFNQPKHPYTRALLAAEPRPDPAPPRPESPVVMSADNLKVWFPIKRGLLRSIVGHIKAVDGVSLSVRKGETLGVVGESGSGKTTLGLALLRLISSDGPIVFLGNKIQGLRFKEMRPFRRDMQIVFQDPFGALSPRMSIGDIVAEGLTVHQKSLSEAERDARVIRALRDVGLDPATRFRYPHEFSGGQRQRISIARAVVLEPSFIVLDEPTSALDMLFQAQMVDLLRELQRKRDLTYMFISHDLRVVASLASHLIVMRNGCSSTRRPTIPARCLRRLSSWRRRTRVSSGNSGCCFSLRREACRAVRAHSPERSRYLRHIRRWCGQRRTRPFAPR
jgi:microcin C transport system ATP-binding protein